MTDDQLEVQEHRVCDHHDPEAEGRSPFATPEGMSTLRWRLFLALEVALLSVGVVSLVALALFDLPLYFSVNLVALPCLALAVWMGIRAHQLRHEVVVNRLLLGVLIGIPATLAYDGVRWLLQVSGAIGFDPFLSHPIFGSLIVNQPVETTAAVVVGWGYHFWNGLSFAAIYTLVAGRVHWGYAMGWAVALEVGWLAALPGALEFNLHPQLVLVSIVGHLAYGGVLGMSAQRWVAA